jgi:transposase-like protein
MERERREVWAKRVERWADSGLTAQEFAAEIGVNANTLASWRWRLKAMSAVRPGATAQSTAPAFVEVVETAGVVGAGPVAVKAEPLELVLPSGLRVLVPVHFDAASLRSLVAVLGDR